MRAIDEVAQDAFILPSHFPHTASKPSKRHQAPYIQHWISFETAG